MEISLHSLVLLLVLAAGASASAQTTWHVDDECTPPGAGTEDQPFCAIQDGVDASSDGDTVLVGPGTYSGNGNRDISFFGKLITLKSTDGPNSTIMDIEGGPDSIHRGFFLIHSETNDTIIEGFTIMNGYLIGDTGGSGAAGGGGGAGLFIRDSSPTIRNCVIRNNTSATFGQPFLVDGRGAGIYIDGDSGAMIDGCIIANNVSEKRGGGLYIGFDSSTVTVRTCLLNGNSAAAGGGVYNTFSETSITNTTIVNNTATAGGGIQNEHGELLLSNCTLWENTADASGHQIFAQGLGLTFEYSNVQGGLAGVEGCCNWDINWGDGMIDADPLFVDPENGDFRISASSPCTDAGNNLAVPEGVETDLNGRPRFLDDPSTPDTGNPDPDEPKLPIVDIGPYEFDPDDCNNNDLPDEEDINSGTSSDIDGNGIPDECQSDCNDNDIPDSYEISEGTSDDCNGNGIPDECAGEPGDLPITQQPVSQEVAVGEFVFFNIEADGDLLEYQWRKDRVALVDSERIFGSTQAQLLIFEIVPGDAGDYDCVVADLFGNCTTSDAATLTVLNTCPADINDDGVVGPVDLAMLLGSWGPCADPAACPADLNADAVVNPLDLATLLAAWGECR